MRGSTFPAEVQKFIRENVWGRTCRELTQLVNEHFGEALFTEATMLAYKKNHKLRSGTPRGMPVGSSRKWSPEVRQYIVEIAEGKSREEITRLVNNRFGTGTMTLSQVNAYMNNHRIRSGVNSRFQPGGTPFNAGRKGWYPPGCEKTWFHAGHRSDNAVPIGTEKLREDGYVYVKTRDGHGMKNWTQKHRLIWETEHGPVPKGHVVIFLDGDRNNFALENLALISRAEHEVMCKRGLHFQHGELTQSSILVAKVMLATKRKSPKQETVELRRLVQEALDKAGGPIVLEVKDGDKVRRIRISPDGGVERLWEEDKHEET